ncbi:MAG: RNA methyltransferase [Peptoniphilaceae bacterium]|nr:RNA methyltransferase [Peptoniphilaceae bacterium]MDY6018453.1 RNA methyltransferase [Anaerococcus sp.]
MIIRSATNPKYKYIKKLSKKKYRKKYKAFVIESKKIVEEVTNPAITENAIVDFVFVNEDMKDFKTSHEKIVFSNDLFEKISLMKNPEGLSAVVKMPKAQKIKADRILLLDHIQDPGNLGTIIRSAEAFAFTDIILYNDCVDLYNEKTLRASMGSIFRLNFTNLNKDQIFSLKKDYKIIGADMGGSDIREFKKSQKIILCIGNEANGLSAYIREIADSFVAIPMKGKIESLNAAIAASILMNNLSL